MCCVVDNNFLGLYFTFKYISFSVNSNKPSGNNEEQSELRD